MLMENNEYEGVAEWREGDEARELDLAQREENFIKLNFNN